jgi:hypothetical protein
MGEGPDASQPQARKGPTDLCDWCGLILEAGISGVLEVVADSSAVHPTSPRQDGRRLLVACSVEHLSQTAEPYRHRPFVVEELWAGKIARALRVHRGRIPPEELPRETGLDPAQIMRAIAWSGNKRGPGRLMGA